MSAPKQRTEYTEEQRLKIVQMHEQHKTTRDIAKALKLSQSGVAKTIQRVATRHTLSDLPRSGRPCKISKGIVRNLGVLSKRGKLDTLANMKVYVKEQDGVSASRSTIASALHKAGYKAMSVQRKPISSPRTRAQRLKWAREQL